MKLSEIARHEVICFGPDDSIDKAIALMEEHRIRHLPVIDGRTLVGMVSDRDVMSAVGWLPSHERIATEEDPGIVGPLRAAEVMSTPVVACSPDDSIEEAGQLMLARRIHAVPLVRDERLVGIVTETDFLRCYLDQRHFAPRRAFRFAKVGDHMSAHVFTVRPDDTLATVVRIIREKGVRHLPVVNGRRLVGIVSDHDARLTLGRSAVDRLSQTGPTLSVPTTAVVRDLMTESVETISPAASLAEAADRMLERRIGALPVIRDHELAGIITETDLLRVFVSACEA